MKAENRRRNGAAVPMGIAAGTSASCQSGNTLTTNCDADDSRTLNDSALTVANVRQAR